MNANLSLTEWRCAVCGGLLGFLRNGRLHLKHRNLPAPSRCGCSFFIRGFF